MGQLPPHAPLKLLLVSASPKDHPRPPVENELLKAAYDLEEPMANHRVIVDEVLHCTREKLGEILRCNADTGYDILYFTGHGHFNRQGYVILEKADGTADPVSANDVVTLLRRQRETFSLVFLNCCTAAVGDEETKEKNAFGDVARKILKMGVPHVVTTRASLYDDTGGTAMKTFFEELGQDPINPTRTGDDTWQIRPHPQKEDVRLTEEEQADKNFPGRVEYISRIEDAWWNQSAHVVGLHGPGGIGKTYLCSGLQQRVLSHTVPARSFNKSIFIDFRQGAGHTLHLFLNQLIEIAHDLGFPEYETTVNDDETYPTAQEKLRPFTRRLDNRYQGKVLLILDNLESALDEGGIFRDEELGKWFRLLLAKTSRATKIVVASRFPFEFFPHGRDGVQGRWFHVGELGITERLSLLNRQAPLRRKTWGEKKEILRAAGGHPYLLKMILTYVGQNHHLPGAALKTPGETATARLDGFLSLLSPEALEWLIVAAVFPEPRTMGGIIITRSIRDRVTDTDPLQKTYRQAAGQWTKLGLAAVEDNGITLDPPLVFQLLDNKESAFRQTGEKIEELRIAVGQFFLLWAGQTAERPQKATILRQGVENLLAQADMELIIAYLQECAKVFHGFVPGPVFVDMVDRVEERLLARGDEISFHTLEFCAQILKDMQLFSRSLALYMRMLSHNRMPGKYTGEFYGQMGNIYFDQRQWEPALENYRKAVQWFKKNANPIYLGGTYHQVGMVYEEQRQWEPALENYQQAIRLYKKTGSHFLLGITYHQVGMVHEGQGQWEPALENYQQSIRWKKKTGNHIQLGITYHQVGMVHARQQQWEPALINYRQSIRWNEKTGNHVQLGGTYHQVGMVYAGQGKWKPALEKYQQAIRWHEKTGNYFELGVTTHQIGRVYESRGDIGSAFSSYKTGLLLSFQHKNQGAAGFNFRSLARIFPKLSPDQVGTLEIEFGGEMVQKLKKYL